MSPQRRGAFVTLLAGGLTLCVGVAIALAAGPFITVKPASGPRSHFINSPGPVEVQTEVRVFGDVVAGAPGALIGPDVYWGSVAPANLVYTEDSGFDAEGNFDVTFEIPTTQNGLDPVRPGVHTIIVCSRARAAPCPVSVSGTFTIVKPLVTLSRTEGRPGNQVTVHGARFSPGNLDELVRVTFDGDIVFEGYPSSSKFDVPFEVPGVPPGTYKVVTCNVPYDPPGPACAPADKVTRNFTVLDPILTLSKSSGLTGSPFDFSGDIFMPSSSVKVWFGPEGADPGDPGVHEIAPGSATTNADGHFGKFAYSPTEGPGDFTVTACTISVRLTTCNPFDIATKPYTITAPTPSPTKSPSPTPSPSPNPTAVPSESPSPSPSLNPSPSLTASPSPSPTVEPSVAPVSAPPTASPTPTPDETAEPTAAPAEPSPTPTPAKALTWPEHLQSPGQTSGRGLDITTLGSIGLLALLIAFLVPFPGTLFNKTVEANHAEIQGWIGGLKRRWTSLLDKFSVGPLRAVRHGLGRLVTGRLGVLVFLGLSALVYSFLSPTFGFDANSVALFLGLLVGLAFITAAFDLPLRIYHGRTSKAHDRGVLRALWWTLLVAVICVVVSRLADFQPGYLYGLVVSIVFVTEISRRDEGIGVWLASFWLIILSFVAWVLLAFVREGAEFDPWLSLFLQTVLVTFVVAGIETLAVGLLPMRFLPGHPLYLWRRGAWFVVFALSVMGYLLILVDPANGYLSDDSRGPLLVGVLFLVTFGIVSLGTWAYFRYRPARVGLDSPTEAPSA